MRKRLVLGLGLLAALGLVLGGYASGSRGAAADSAAFDQAHSDLTPAQAARFGEMALYSLGERFEGLPLTAITRRRAPAAALEPMATDFVGFHYGDCVPVGDAGCPAPVQVQVWPACVRNHASYQLTPAGGELPHREVRIRGVPGAVYEEGMRLELYTGLETIVVFAEDETLLFRVAAALRSANGGGVEAGERLAPPAVGALAGKAACP